MHETLLKKISLVGSVIGILFLFIITGLQYQERVEIANINEDYTNKIVKTVGFIDEIRQSEDNIFLHIKDNTGGIKIVLWKNNVIILEKEDIINNLKRGVKIEVIGEVEMYNNELEIIVNEGAVKIII